MKPYEDKRSKRKRTGQIRDSSLSRREREIMEVIYQLGEASVSDVVARLGDDPSYDSIRVTLGILTSKGHLSHYQDGRRYIYRPMVPREKAGRSAVKKLLRTFFAGSPSKAIVTMLDMSSGRLTKKELDEIEAMIKKRRG
jgi:predicted transcriptional regulator